MANLVELNSLSIREKISQMIVVNGGNFNEDFAAIGIGGLMPPKFESLEENKRFIEGSQNMSDILLFVVADLEGYLNPFKGFYHSIIFDEVENHNQAFDLGSEHGEVLNRMGFNWNFSPICEYRDDVWPGRSFKGDIPEIERKIIHYIKGLQSKGIIATAKHYPGKNMVKDPHKKEYCVNIWSKDLDLFKAAFESKVKSAMVGHPRVKGKVDSRGLPSTISYDVVSHLKNYFGGLICTDDISMQGLRNYYGSSFDSIYSDLIKAGHDLILDTSSDSDFGSVLRKIKDVENCYYEGSISLQRINSSVKKILLHKGYLVK